MQNEQKRCDGRHKSLMELQIDEGKVFFFHEQNLQIVHQGYKLSKTTDDFSKNFFEKRKL